jgi:hypothetical protein
LPFPWGCLTSADRCRPGGIFGLIFIAALLLIGLPWLAFVA